MMRATKEQVYQDYIIDRLEWREIASKYGYKSATSVEQLIKKYEIPRRDEDLLHENVLRRMYIDEGKSCIDISKEVGLSKPCVLRRMKKYGIEPSPRRVKERKLRTGVGDLTGKFWSNIKNNAKVRNIKFDLTIEFAWELIKKQNFKCAISGVEIYFAKKGERYNRTTASLDRIDSTKGYDENNVYWVHKDVNSMKWELSFKDFIHWCCKIKSFQLNKIFETKEFGNYKKFPGGYEKISGNMWCSIKCCAGERGISLLISIKEAWELFEQQNGICKISGESIDFSEKSTHWYKSATASLDRIDSSKNYSIDNCQWVHKIVNKMKGRLLESDFIKWCFIISDFNEVK